LLERPRRLEIKPAGPSVRYAFNADIPDGTQAPAAVPRPPPSIAADPNPAAPRAATTPHRSSVDPSPQTPPGKSAGSVISNWHRGDILIGRLHDRLAPSNLGKSGFREPITPVTPDFDIREGRPAAARRAPVSRRALEVLSCGELGRGASVNPPIRGDPQRRSPGGGIPMAMGVGCGRRHKPASARVTSTRSDFSCAPRLR
jgi:hypothetical protein